MFSLLCPVLTSWDLVLHKAGVHTEKVLPGGRVRGGGPGGSAVPLVALHPRGSALPGRPDQPQGAGFLPRVRMRVARRSTNRRPRSEIRLRQSQVAFRVSLRSLKLQSQWKIKTRAL